MKQVCFLFVFGLLCISKVGLYGQQKNIFRKIETEIGVGVVFGSQKIGFDKIDVALHQVIKHIHSLLCHERELNCFIIGV